MAAAYPPFMNAYGTADKILSKIKEAQTPDRFTQDFLATKLGFLGGTPKSFIPFAKRLGLLESDGKPTELYKRFRNPGQSKAAMAEAIKKGYPQLYERNECAHELSKENLTGLVMEITGLEKGHATVRAIVGTFEVLKKLADFEAHKKAKEPHSTPLQVQEPLQGGEQLARSEDVGLNIAYTINLVLPKTDDAAVFNAIFKSLREHLLKR